MPLHVFEERYRALMRHVTAGDRRFGIVMIGRGSEVSATQAAQGGLPDLRRDLAAIDALVQVALHCGQSAGQGLGIGVGQDHGAARHRTHLGDAMTHRACANHSDPVSYTHLTLPTNREV